MMMMTMMRPHRCCRRSRERCMIVVVAVVTWETCWKSREISFNECETGRQARFRKCGRRRIEDSENEDQHHPFSIEKKSIPRKRKENKKSRDLLDSERRSRLFHTSIKLHQNCPAWPLSFPQHTHTHTHHQVCIA